MRLSTFGGQLPMPYSKKTCEEQVDLYHIGYVVLVRGTIMKMGGGQTSDTWCTVCCNLDKAAVMDRAADVL